VAVLLGDDVVGNDRLALPHEVTLSSTSAGDSDGPARRRVRNSGGPGLSAAAAAPPRRLPVSVESGMAGTLPG
jgi:hypothetical protein